MAALPRGRLHCDARAGIRPARGALSGIDGALAALHSDEPGPTGDDAIAECEQRRREFMDRQQAQAELPLPRTVAE